MTQKRYDMIVVGAGPAGGTAAYELARPGRASASVGRLAVRLGEESCNYCHREHTV